MVTDVSEYRDGFILKVAHCQRHYTISVDLNFRNSNTRSAVASLGHSAALL